MRQIWAAQKPIKKYQQIRKTKNDNENKIKGYRNNRKLLCNPKANAVSRLHYRFEGAMKNTPLGWMPWNKCYTYFVIVLCWNGAKWIRLNDNNIVYCIVGHRSTTKWIRDWWCHNMYRVYTKRCSWSAVLFSFWIPKVVHRLSVFGLQLSSGIFQLLWNDVVVCVVINWGQKQDHAWWLIVEMPKHSFHLDGILKNVLIVTAQ